MGVYLKKFENHTAYEAAESSLILPNVSLCEDDGGVYYKPYDPYNGHEYVDLGLPSGTMWATMNVGANSETGYGNFYQYGKGASQYASTSGDSDYSGTETPLATSADTVAQVWGGSWHMPTQEQFDELKANTTYRWIDNYKGAGVSGATFTAQNGNYVFLPAAGTYNDGSRSLIGDDGYYWCSSPDGSEKAYGFSFYGGGKKTNPYYRKYGYSIRGVVG